MDKEKAERLVRAIERTHVDWLRVEAVEFEPKRQTYVLKCAYKEAEKGQFSRRERRVTRWISSPREWIDLLVSHRNDLEPPH